MSEEIEKIRLEEMPDDYWPPKDMANAIWGACFDYQNIDTIVGDISIRDRVKYACFIVEKIYKIQELCKKK